MIEIGVRELKSRLSETLRRVGGGEPVTVTSRGEPVAEIWPPRAAAEAPIDPALLRMEAEGRIQLSRVPKSQRPPANPVKWKSPKSASDLIIEGRAERF